jgi:acetylornithine deacetylase/succinyl-diaminopimelate desuccinylase-like protein
VPDNDEDLNRSLFINTSENVGHTYQEALQYPSLNIRQIETSWKGDAPKTVIPEFAKVAIDLRLVMETDGEQQLQKIKNHIINQGFLLLDRAPTDSERLHNSKIVTFIGNKGVNAFRTDVNNEFGVLLKNQLKSTLKESPVIIRTMGGTVPIIPAIKVLGIPAIIVPMVNMDNNQHNPNENIRIGNIRQGIKICLSIFNMKL